MLIHEVVGGGGCPSIETASASNGSIGVGWAGGSVDDGDGDPNGEEEFRSNGDFAGVQENGAGCSRPSSGTRCGVFSLIEFDAIELQRVPLGFI
jgi:hypothetical protein